MRLVRRRSWKRPSFAKLSPPKSYARRLVSRHRRSLRARQMRLTILFWRSRSPASSLGDPSFPNTTPSTMLFGSFASPRILSFLPAQVYVSILDCNLKCIKANRCFSRSQRVWASPISVLKTLGSIQNWRIWASVILRKSSISMSSGRIRASSFLLRRISFRRKRNGRLPMGSFGFFKTRENC